MIKIALLIAFVAVSATPKYAQAQVLYEEHFTDGQTHLEWFGNYGPLGFQTDTMQVIEDPTTPQGDGWIGMVARSDSCPCGMAYATGDLDLLTDYSIEAWVFVEVWPESATGLFNGLVIRLLPLPGNWGLDSKFYSFMANFDDSLHGSGFHGLRLAYHDAMIPSWKFLWTGDQIPGGVPNESGWHRMKIKTIGDSIWVFWDGVMLDGCPKIHSQGMSMGYFGVYTFRFWMSEGVETRVDSIMVLDETAGIEKNRSFSVQTIKSPLRVYPNPFQRETSVQLNLPGKTKPMNTQIYNICGELITEMSLKEESPGIWSAIWKGRDGKGNSVPAGVYFFSVRTDEFVTECRTILIR
jgi:hypothetical protein